MARDAAVLGGKVSARGVCATIQQRTDGAFLMDKTESKAVAAILAQAEARADVARLTKEIGEALDACKGVKGKFTHETSEYGKWKTGDDETHLHSAYTPEEIDDGTDYLTDEEVRDYLAACPACLRAHELIQQRKAAKRRLGTARMRITLLGQAMLKARA